jgi:hypothetical protein
MYGSITLGQFLRVSYLLFVMCKAEILVTVPSPDGCHEQTKGGTELNAHMVLDKEDAQ